MIPVAEAQQFLQQQLTSAPDVFTLPLSEAIGLVLARDIISPVAVPPVDNSAMDGFAVRLADIQPGEAYSCQQRICAGDAPASMESSVARIFTGAPVPDGADAVIIQENAEQSGDGSYRFAVLPEAGANIRPAGQDIAKGSVVLPAGVRLDAARLGLLASVGISGVAVNRPLKVAVLTSGDELVEPGLPLPPGKIYNSNATLLSAMLSADCFSLVSIGHVVDDRQATREMIVELTSNCDVLLCTGGVSVGEEDHVGHVLQEMGEMSIWKLAIKPGKPLAYSRIGTTHCFGLPGNPVSGFVTYQVIIRPFLRQLQGETGFGLFSVPVKLAEAVKTGKREEYFRASLNQSGEAVLFPNQSSGVLSSVAASQGLLKVKANCQLNAGDWADFYPVNIA